MSAPSNSLADQLSTTPCMQTFNKGLFDFLIATDDPTKQDAEKVSHSAVGATTDMAASDRQLPGAGAEVAQEAAGEGAGTPGGDSDVEAAAPDHAWTETAAAVKSTEVGGPETLHLCFGTQVCVALWLQLVYIVWRPQQA